MAALAFPPQGGRWPAGPDEGDEVRHITPVGTLISLASLDSLPLGGGIHVGRKLPPPPCRGAPMCAPKTGADTQVRPYGQERTEIFAGAAPCGRPRADGDIGPYEYHEPKLPDQPCARRVAARHAKRNPVGRRPAPKISLLTTQVYSDKLQSERGLLE